MSQRDRPLHYTWFANAQAMYDEGRTAEAEALCRRVLAVEPRFQAACHLLGLIVHQDGLQACRRRDLPASAATFERLAPVVRLMADTGYGSDACLRDACLPMPVHFYSPVPDLEDLRRRGVWQRRSPMAGIDVDVDGQLALLRELGAAFGKECRWPDTAPPDMPGAFYLDNDTFGYGCAAALHTMIRRFRPKRLIEVGSGMSSRIIRDALVRNAAETGEPAAEYSIIDPHAPETVEALVQPLAARVLRQGVETVDLAFFDELGHGDILFIDSGHTVRMGGDTNFLILDVLPRLRSGVLVHFHDIHLPYEYAEVYAVNPAARVFWTEAYLLQAFLCFNRSFQVTLALALLMIEHADAFRSALPYGDGRTVSGSFWIRRVDDQGKA